MSTNLYSPWNLLKLSPRSTLEQRREDARRQRQNAEQRRRDQLRDGYDRLQSVLPGAKEKMSKVRLIECGQFSVLAGLSLL